jgi:hypothetical protein
MRSKLRGAVLALLLVPAITAIAHTQTRRMHIGPHVAFEFDNQDFAIGAQFSVPVARHLEAYPSFDYYFVDVGSLWALNADLKWRVARERPDWLYLGTGLNISRSTVNDFHHTDAGLNLIVGVESLKGKVHPFGEGRLIVSDETRFQLAAGLNFTLGHQ